MSAHSAKFPSWGLVAMLAMVVVCLNSPGANAEDAKPPSTLGLLTTSGLNDAFAKLGIQFNVTYIGETLGNASGGVRQGGVFTGRLDLGTDIDLDKMMGWTGARFHANVFQINGQGLSRDYVGNLMLVSNIEALTSTRLYEAWIEQLLLNNRIAIRVGQQAADVEFFDSLYDDVFINSSVGWPAISRDQPAERWSVATARRSRHSDKGAAFRSSHRLCRDLRRQRCRAWSRRSADRQPERACFPRQRPATGHWAGEVWL